MIIFLSDNDSISVMVLKGQLNSSLVFHTPPSNLHKFKSSRSRGCAASVQLLASGSCETLRKLAFNISGNTISSTLKVASAEPDADICASKTDILNDMLKKVGSHKNLM